MPREVVVLPPQKLPSTAAGFRESARGQGLSFFSRVTQQGKWLKAAL